MADQEKNAANMGDRLKGTLKSLVIDGCSTWTDFVYSESHAGKGVYPHTDEIGELFDEVVKSKPSQTDDPAYLYHQLLNNWIKSKPQGNVDYPGSVVQALSCFTSKQTNVELRLTEYDKQTCGALRQNVLAFKKNLIVDVKQASFQNEIPWLTATQDDKDLVLFLDPFTYSNINKSFGSINWSDLMKVIDPCWSKKRAVIVLWTKLRYFHPTSFTVEKNEKTSKDGRKLVEDLRQEATNHHEKFSCFYHGEYFMLFLGIGSDGRQLVQDLDNKFQQVSTHCWCGKVTKLS
jgi:hypothetical protein